MFFTRNSTVQRSLPIKWIGRRWIHFFHLKNCKAPPSTTLIFEDFDLRLMEISIWFEIKIIIIIKKKLKSENNIIVL